MERERESLHIYSHSQNSKTSTIKPGTAKGQPGVMPRYRVHRDGAEFS